VNEKARHSPYPVAPVSRIPNLPGPGFVRNSKGFCSIPSATGGRGEDCFLPGSRALLALPRTF